MGLKYLELSMSSSSARRAAICFCWGLFLMLPAALFAQTNYYGANGTEYAVAGALPGDQVWPDVALGSQGGFIVWQDNATDGNGLGISAQRVDTTLAGTLSTFRVNASASNNQQNARVALLKNGGAVFAWQGGKDGFQHIYARFLNTNNTFLMATDVLVSLPATATNSQLNPAVTVLNNSNVVVVWSSLNQVRSNSMQDVYGQIFTPAGKKVGTNFLVNQFTAYSQRTPTVAALKNGGFAVAWVSDQQRVLAPIVSGNSDLPSSVAGAITTPSVDVYARLFNSNGVATTTEFLVNSNLFPCANPAMAAGDDGGFLLAWTAHNTIVTSNSLDIYARSYSGAGVGGSIVTVNANLYGDQYAPRVSAIGTDFMVVWMSAGQDGSREGVFGRFMHAGGMFTSDEFRVNTATLGGQLQPTVASDGASQFVAVWSSFSGYIGGSSGMDLYAQRYINVASLLAPMAAPYVSAPFTLVNGTYQPQLQVAWPRVLGISVANYEVYVDGNASPAGVTASNVWTMTAANGLTAGSTHTFAVDYVTSGGARSPLSPLASGTTWSGCDWGGIPCEWMTNYFGSNRANWPSASVDSDGDGAGNLQEFRAGTAPNNAGSVLHQQLVQTQQGLYLTWNTQPGLIYQVQVTTNLTTWSNFGSPRFASGTTDSIFVGGSPGYYRIELQR